jgi:hypothetical protein
VKEQYKSGLEGQADGYLLWDYARDFPGYGFLGGLKMHGGWDGVVSDIGEHPFE